MSLASALLQPQVIARPAPDREAALVEDITRLAALFLEDAAAEGGAGGALVRALRDTLTDRLPALQTLLAPRIDAARARVRGRFAGPRAALLGLIGDAPTAEGVLAAFSDLLDGLAVGIARVDLPRIRAELAPLGLLLTEDLGLTGGLLRDIGLGHLDALGLRIEAAAAVEGDADSRRRLRLARALIARLRAELAGLEMPRIDLDALARLIARLLAGASVQATLREIACALRALSAAAEAGSAVAAALRPVPQPVGAGIVPVPGAIDYAWYASWLIQDIDNFFVCLSDLADPVRFLRLLRTGEVPLTAALRERFSAPEIQRLSDSADEAEPSRDTLLFALSLVNRAIQQGPLLGDGFDGPEVLTAAQQEADVAGLKADWEENQELHLLNRRVVEAAFGGAVDTLSGGFWRALGGFFGPLTGWPRNQVYVTGDGRYVMIDDAPIHFGEGVRWFDAILFKEDVRGARWYDFHCVGPEACEILARVLFPAAEAGKAVWHLVDTQPGHEMQAGFAGGIEIADTVHQILLAKPLSAYFLEKGGHARRWGKSLDSMLGLKGMTTFGASFQGLHTDAPAGNAFACWVTVFLGDFFRTAGPVQTCNTLRDLVLCVVTLINFRGPQDGPSSLPTNPSANRHKQGPITGLSDTLFIMALLGAYDRDDYSVHLWSDAGIADRRRRAMLGHWLGGSIGMGIASGLTGSIVAQTLAWAEDWAQLGKTIGVSVGKTFGLYWIFNYLLVENTTDDGRYRPGGGRMGGYPAKDPVASPYLLPMPGGRALYTGQANLGIFSHNFISNTDFVTPGNSSTLQTYAYDFAHDFDEPIACCRAGVVFSFREGNADSSTGQNNRIIIRHTTIDPVHDVFNGVAVQTYGVYLHLSQNGVTRAPAFGGTSPAQATNGVPGTPVAQGDLIALAGDTGLSFHNHLHLHIVPDDGTGQPSNLIAMPFVFEDAPGDGVLKSRTWYRSGNR